MKQLTNLNYNFEELEVLKTLAKFPNDPDKAEKLLFSGLNEYEASRIRKTIVKFFNDGIWDFEENYGEKGRSTFKIDLRDFILNYPNPIPENLRSGIDTNAIIEKLSCSNLNLFEINYLTTLLKKDAVTEF